jgi:hypothetical protein
MEALGAIGFFLLVVHAIAHVALVVAIVRVKRLRGALAFVFPPAGVVWGWEAGKKGLVVAYAATLLAFSVVVTVIAYAR